MSEPWTPSYTAAVLSGMPDERLATITPKAFCMWPTRRPLPPDIGRDLIAQERARRRIIPAGGQAG